MSIELNDGGYLLYCTYANDRGLRGIFSSGVENRGSKFEALQYPKVVSLISVCEHGLVESVQPVFKRLSDLTLEWEHLVTHPPYFNFAFLLNPTFAELNAHRISPPPPEDRKHGPPMPNEVLYGLKSLPIQVFSGVMVYESEGSFTRASGLLKRVITDARQNDRSIPDLELISKDGKSCEVI